MPESINRQCKDKLLHETVQAARNIRAPGFSKVDEVLVSEIVCPEESVSAEKMVDDVNLEEEESQECEEERDKISAGYLSKKITNLAHLKEFMRAETESDSGLVN